MAVKPAAEGENTSQFDFSKIKESNRFGLHIRIETSSTGEKFVKIDSTFEKYLHTARSALSRGETDIRYVKTGQEAKQLLLESKLDPESPQAKKVDKIAVKLMVRSSMGRDAIPEREGQLAPVFDKQETELLKKLQKKTSLFLRCQNRFFLMKTLHKKNLQN